MKRGRKMRVIVAIAVLGSLAWLCLPSDAHATPIGFVSGEIDFFGTGTGALTAFIPADIIPAGYGCRPQNFICGELILGPRGGGFTGQPAGAELFVLDGVNSFTFTQQLSTGVVDTVTGTIDWQLFQGSHASFGRLFAHVTGFITISSSSGDAAFVNDFHPGTIATIDLSIFNVFSDFATWDELALTAGGMALGEFQGGITPIPEPSSLLLVSSAALIGLGAIARRLGVMT